MIQRFAQSHDENLNCNGKELFCPRINHNESLVQVDDIHKRDNYFLLTYDLHKFEVELITVSGSYWGEIALIELPKANYIYFKSKQAKIDNQMALNELKYNFRSMSDTQREDRLEILININDVNEIMNKHFLCNPIAIEIFDIKHNRMYLFNFFSENTRNRFIDTMAKYCNRERLITNPKYEFQQRKYSTNWSNLKISTFDYLMIVNKFSGRSYNDTSQYPIIPWIGPCGCDEFEDINSPRKLNKQNRSQIEGNFNSSKDEELTISQTEKDDNIDDSLKLRDLKLHTARLCKMKEQSCAISYEEGVSEFETEIYGESAFNIKFGFSNSQLVLSNLIRIYPYTNLFIIYNGKLDHPDRMVSSYNDQWRKVLSATQCNNELIPEWFYLPQIHFNSSYCYFGINNEELLVSNVKLPNWSK